MYSVIGKSKVRLKVVRPESAKIRILPSLGPAAAERRWGRRQGRGPRHWVTIREMAEKQHFRLASKSSISQTRADLPVRVSHVEAAETQTAFEAGLRDRLIMGLYSSSWRL